MSYLSVTGTLLKLVVALLLARTLKLDTSGLRSDPEWAYPLPLTQISRNSFGNMRGLANLRFWKFPRKYDPFRQLVDGLWEIP